MKTIAKILSLILLSFCGFSGMGQDIHFSQFYASPLTFSPSETGNFDGDWRISNNYRRQWDAIGIPYETVSIGGDILFEIKNHKIGAGLSIVNDRSGDSKLTVNKILASLSYKKRSGIHRVCLGVQGGYIMKSFSIEKLSFPNQYDYSSGLFDSQLPHNEVDLNEQLSYIDFNAGISYKPMIGGSEPYLTIAAYHINQPNESFNGGDYRLPMRLVYAVGGIFNLNGRLFLQPNILYMNQGGSSDLLIGTFLGYRLPSKQFKTIMIGPYFRGDALTTKDAVIAAVSMNVNRFDVGISYDINISGLTTVTNNRGALEISLIYKAVSTKVYKTSIPCERY